MARKIDELLDLVPEGESRSFKATIDDPHEDRFVEVAYNWNYGSIISWNNRPENGPWMGSRSKPRIGLQEFSEPDVSFDRDVEDLVDFHSPSPGLHVVSNKLLELIELHDPGSLETRAILIQARNGMADFNMVMPKRLLHAVDADRCDVDIVSKKLDTIWVKRVNFPDGAFFDPNIPNEIHNFADIDVKNRWFWSRLLVDLAKNSAIKGVRTKKAAGLTSQQFDEF